MNSAQKLRGVVEIQRILKDIFSSDISIDGIFGESTETSIKEFQRIIKVVAPSISVTGAIDQQTLAFLFHAWDNQEKFKALKIQHDTNNNATEETITYDNNASEEEEEASTTVSSFPTVSPSEKPYFDVSPSPGPLFSSVAPIQMPQTEEMENDSGIQNQETNDGTNSHKNTQTNAN